MMQKRWNAVPNTGKLYLAFVLLGIAIQNSPYSLNYRPFLLYLVALLCYTAILPIMLWKPNPSGFGRFSQLFCAFLFSIIGILGLLFVAKV
jgi:hypothetical protein